MKLASRYNHVVLMDGRYKTNRYWVPLLHIIGMTALNTTFTLASCFRSGRKWRIMRGQCRNCQQCEKMNLRRSNLHGPGTGPYGGHRTNFPSSSNLLCNRHIKKNIVANCKKQYTTRKYFDEFLQKWNALISSQMVVEYDEQLAKFSDNLLEKSDYVKKN